MTRILYCESIINHKIGLNTHFSDIAESLGWILTIDEDNTERAYDGSLWEKGYAPQKPLEELKLEKRAEINAARDAAEQGGFFYMGKTFDSDIVSCIRIQGAAQSMQAASMAEEVPTITWTCQDNSTIELSAQELLGLSVALAEWSNTCHQKASALKAQIENATSEEELEKISWNV